MLSRYFAQVSQVNIYIPNHFDTKLLALLFVVDRGPPNNTVQFRHEVVPAASLEKGEAAVIKSLHCLSRWFLKEINSKVLLSFVEPTLLVFQSFLAQIFKFYRLYLRLAYDLDNFFDDSTVN